MKAYEMTIALFLIAFLSLGVLGIHHPQATPIGLAIILLLGLGHSLWLGLKTYRGMNVSRYAEDTLIITVLLGVVALVFQSRTAEELQLRSVICVFIIMMHAWASNVRSASWRTRL